MKISTQNESGFTLIEVIIALAIFATISIVAYKGIDQLLKTKTRIEMEDQKWQNLMIFFDRFESDLHHHINRPIRNKEDQPEPAWLGKPLFQGEADAQLSISRLGEAEQNGFLMDSRRVGYRLKDGAIETVLWPALDMAPSANPEVFKLVENVTEFSILYLTANGQWSPNWPTEKLLGEQNYAPKAVSILVRLQSGESISRVFAL